MYPSLPSASGVYFCVLQADLSSRQQWRGGKSGQRRATHHVTRGSQSDLRTDRVTENNRPGVKPVLRVKMCGKSTRSRQVTNEADKPCVLKCHVYHGWWRYRATGVAASWAARSTVSDTSMEGRQLESRS